MTRKPKRAPCPLKIPSDRIAVENGCYFDRDAAEKVCEFFERFLRHSAGRFAGRPFLLEAWQREFLGRLYGWKRPDGTRRFREAYLEVPKKNGKSSMLAGLALFAVFEEPGAEVYLGACDRSQASIIFDECARMVRASPALSCHLKIIDSKKRIVFPARDAKLVAMSADAPSKDGVNASMVILDELHRFKSPALHDVMKYAGAAREQPLFLVITTAGHDRKTICYELHERALAAIAGTAEGGDVEFLPVVYAADPEKDDLDATSTWRKANPSLGTVIREEDFAKAHQEAKLLPRLWAAFLRLRLNVWTEQVTRWIPLELWDAGSSPIVPPLPKGKPCYATLDLSSVADLTSLTLLFPEKDEAANLDLVRFVPYFFVPKESAERRSEVDKVPYPRWIEQGHVIGTEGNATDHAAIRKHMNDLVESGVEIVAVAIDPWNAQQLANELVDDGFDVVFMRQGYPTLTGPCKELERRLLAGTVKHDGNPCLRWNISNVATEQDAAGNIKPSKKRSAERIDGVVSAVMALGLYMSRPEQGVPTFTPINRG